MNNMQMVRAIGCVLVLCVGSTAAVWAADVPRVELIQTPNRGIQPQVAIDEDGRVHLIYFRGKADGGNVYYVWSDDEGKQFSKPLRVNSNKNSVVAQGSMRGAHLAVGRKGRVHIAWMGSQKAKPKAPGGKTPMLYARLNARGTEFERQRNLVKFAVGLDGGGSVAADDKGNVVVAWHAGAGEHEEAKRTMWVAWSSDDGRTFAREVKAWDEPAGACGCCGMRAMFDGAGGVNLFYRTARNNTGRGMMLVSSRDGGATFAGREIHPWLLSACPASTASMVKVGQEMVLAWETNQQVYWARWDDAAAPVAAPGSGMRKYPVVTKNHKGQVLLAWSQDAGWGRRGSAAWQVYDDQGTAHGHMGQGPKMRKWSFPAVFTKADGDFVVLY